MAAIEGSRYVSAFLSRGWPTAKGVVSRTGTSQDVYLEGEESCSLDVEYKYTVAGKEYKSEMIYFGSHSFSTVQSQEADRIASTYPLGMEVTVFYDPGSPQNAVLEPRVYGTTFPGLIIGGRAIFVSLAGMAYKLYIWKTWKPFKKVSYLASPLKNINTYSYGGSNAVLCFSQDKSRMGTWRRPAAHVYLLIRDIL
jgi:hypothetical protein